MALGRAQKLMELYKIEADDLKLPDAVDEIRVTNGSSFCTGLCVHGLSHIICKAFGVDYVAHSNNSKIKTVSFIGPKDLLESCEYIYVFLSRLAINAINRYNKTLDLKIACDIVKQREILDFVFTYGPPPAMEIVTSWCIHLDDYDDELLRNDNDDEELAKLLNKLSKEVTDAVKDMRYLFPVFYSYFLKQRRACRRGFIRGYLNAVNSKVVEYSQSHSVEEKIEKYLENHYPNLRTTTRRGRYMGQSEYDAYNQGEDRGSEVSITSALNGTAAHIEELEYF